MSARYKAKPITPVDAVRWNGENLSEVQDLCPEATPVLYAPFWITTEAGQVEVYTGEILMKSIGTQKYSKLTAEVFSALYEPQSPAP
jgi:hypothetical protein